MILLGLAEFIQVLRGAFPVAPWVNMLMENDSMPLAPSEPKTSDCYRNCFPRRSLELLWCIATHVDFDPTCAMVHLPLIGKL